MSLLRLLATGRSLVGMKDGISPYRMCTENLLPNFGAKRNPFRPEARPEPALESAPAKPVEPENLSLFDADLKPIAATPLKSDALPEVAKKSSAGRFEILATEPLSQAKTAVESKPFGIVSVCLPPRTEASLEPVKEVRFAGGRIGDSHGLVEFGSVETALLPVRLQTLAPMAQVLPPVAELPVTVEEKPAVPAMAVAPVATVRKAEKISVSPKAPATQHPARRPVKASAFSRWLAKMNPMFLFAAWGKVGAKRPVRTRPPEQAELLLAQVKPLRNELNDSDLQVVTTTVNPGETKTGGQNVRNETSGTARPWNRLSRIFNSDHVQAG